MLFQQQAQPSSPLLSALWEQSWEQEVVLSCGTDSVSLGLGVCFLWLLQFLSCPRHWCLCADLTWEHRALPGLSWTESVSKVCTEPTTASVVPALSCPAQSNGLTDSFSPSQLSPAVVQQQQRHFHFSFQGAGAGCPVLRSSLLPGEVFICGVKSRNWTVPGEPG